MVLSRIWQKLIVSVLIAGVSILSQLETNNDILISSKDVVLSQSPIHVFEFVTNLEEYRTWFPNIKKTSATDNNPHVSIGKMYQQTSTYVFGISETTTMVVVVGYASPAYFEFLTDSFIQQRDVISMKPGNQNRTMLNWKIYARRRNLLFKYTAVPFFKFYYHQILREALFQMQFTFR